MGQLFATFIFSEQFRNDVMSFLNKAIVIGLFGIPLLLFGYYNINYIIQPMLDSTIDIFMPIQDPFFVRLDLLLYSGIGLIISLIVDWMNRKFIANRDICNQDN